MPSCAPLLAALCLLPAAATAERNLAPNPSFEQASEADPRRPAGWMPHAHGDTSCSWAAEGARSGTRCLQMTARPDEKWGHAYWTSRPIPVRPGMAYRVRFHFKARGWGVPCFSLAKVKDWRLDKHDTEGRWVAHEEVVVVPPGVTATHFSANNYHRPGKTLWLDDVSLVELPLDQSPLTRRLKRARRNVAALRRNLAPMAPLAPEQEKGLLAMGTRLEQAGAAYRKLEAGDAEPADFQRMNAALDAVEEALGAWLLAVWAVEPGAPGRRPPRLGGSPGHAEADLAVEPGGGASLVVGALCLIGEPLPVRATLVAGKRAKAWECTLSVTPAHPLPSGEQPWGAPGPLGGVLLPPGTPRFLRVDLRPREKAGPATLHLRLEALDRTMEPGEIVIRVKPVP
ncbi:MAG: hypothetical protein ACLF0G_04180 [Candidatus Brocadiia bacterium]